MATARTAPRVLCVAALFLTTACMSGGADINAPLPRKSREEALRWAQQYTRAMAHDADVKPAPKTEVKRFHNCVGKNDEVAEDGRFTLTYHIEGDLPRDRHIAAARKLRTALEQHGITGITTTERPQDSRPVDMRGHNKKERFHVRLYSLDNPDQLQFTVTTSCFLPPDAKQQQF
ncbi:hypothetical protein [Streptomyces sp. NPDC003077]|uniref:hypothetical protein n=1 Tax=Streptomyces sp. NPDC003077 TaxID=3154443 RepID=UPI0033AAB4FA